MTQAPSASAQRCVPSIEISSRKFYGYGAIALGVTLLVSGIFLLLAAYQILPNGINAISDLGRGGFILGYATAIVASVVMAYGVWKVYNPNSWKRGLGTHEVEQTFEAFETCDAKMANANRNELNIVIVDNGITKQDIELIRIVSDYIEVVHGVKVTLSRKDILCDAKRRRGQYSIEYNISPLIKDLSKNAFALGFTSKDLYPSNDEDSESINFIFGAGIWEYAAGFFSIYRMRDPFSTETTLINLMKLTSHEFGHMRGLDHCVHYECCMQGYNSVSELGEASLIFCELDMKKICHLNGWSLQNAYQRQIKFFKTFGDRYKQQANFSVEIATLEKRIKNP